MHEGDCGGSARIGYPALQEEAMSLSHDLRQLEQPMIAFSVKQKRPKSLDEEVGRDNVMVISYISNGICMTTSHTLMGCRCNQYARSLSFGPATVAPPKEYP